MLLSHEEAAYARFDETRADVRDLEERLRLRVIERGLLFRWQEAPVHDDRAGDGVPVRPDRVRGRGADEPRSRRDVERDDLALFERVEPSARELEAPEVPRDVPALFAISEVDRVDFCTAQRERDPLRDDEPRLTALRRARKIEHP